MFVSLHRVHLAPTLSRLLGGFAKACDFPKTSRSITHRTVTCFAQRGGPARHRVCLVKLLVEKVIVSPNALEVRLRANGIERLVLELQPAGAAQPEEALA